MITTSAWTKLPLRMYLFRHPQAQLLHDRRQEGSSVACRNKAKSEKASKASPTTPKKKCRVHPHFALRLAGKTPAPDPRPPHLPSFLWSTYVITQPRKMAPFVILGCLCPS